MRLWLRLLLLGGWACGKEELPPPPPPTVLSVLVVDATTGQPIQDAQIYVSGQVWTPTEAGKLRRELSPGRYQIRSIAPGHRPSPEPLAAVTEVLVVAEKTVTATVVMEPATESGAAVLRGNVNQGGAPIADALVVAAGTSSRFGWTDTNGEYRIFGLPAGVYNVSAYGSGTASAGEMAMLSASEERLVNATLSEVTGVAEGAVTGGTTQVYLVSQASGAPLPGLSAQASGAFRFEGVPPAPLVVRAGLELDNKVLDPQPILEDGLPRVQPGQSLQLQLVDAVVGLSPARTSSAAARPTFRWSAFPGADFYVVELHDLSGRVLWGGFDAAKQPRTRVLELQTAYDGPVLTPGVRYSWRVYAGQRDAVVPSSFALIGASEEEGGWFRVTR